MGGHDQKAGYTARFRTIQCFWYRAAPPPESSQVSVVPDLALVLGELLAEASLCFRCSLGRFGHFEVLTALGANAHGWHLA